MNTSGTGKNANIDGQEGTKKVKPPHKKATKAEKANKGNPDTLLGDPVASTATCIEKTKEKWQKDKIGIDDIGIFEFIFYGLPNPPELEGMMKTDYKSYKMMYKSNYTKETKKEREI